MLWNISFLDFRKANGCGARYTPLKALLVHPSPLPLIITKAANIVLNDSENLEAIKAIESGRAFNVGGGFDPRKRPPPGGGPSECTGPTEWLQDMSLCDMYPAGTADAERRHLYRLCKHATPAKLEARKAERQKLFAERRAAQNGQRSSGRNKKPRDAKKAGGESGGAKIAAWHYADDADKANGDSIFSMGDGPRLIDLGDELDSIGSNSRSLMAKAGTSEEASAAATSLAGSTPTPGSSKAASIAPAESLIYVVHDSGDAEVDSICSGILTSATGTPTSCRTSPRASPRNSSTSPSTSGTSSGFRQPECGPERGTPCVRLVSTNN